MTEGKYDAADQSLEYAIRRMLDERFDRPLFVSARTASVPLNAKHRPGRRRTRVFSSAISDTPEYNAQLDAILTYVREELDGVVESGVVRRDGSGAWPGAQQTRTNTLRPQVWLYR